MRILAAEDNSVNQLVLEEVLRWEGAEVTLVGNGQQAVEAVERDSPFDVVLMDIQMPVMGGIEATHILRQIAPSLPVIGQTAHAMKEVHHRCLEAGMAATITKPLDVEILVATVLDHAKASDTKPAVPALELHTPPPQRER